jgi:hypothetical protein
MQYQPQ